MDIQRNILEKLHCNKCNEYLSYAPIMITEDGENLCGRCICENSDKKLIRNKVYEDFASIAVFPCRYKESGCDGTIPWDDMIVHENHCEYRPVDCPTTPKGKCKWKGPQCVLLDHYEETHPELILEHPCSLDNDIVVDNDKNMLLSFLGFVFLIQIRCNTGLSKLWHCVHCFVQPKIARQFSFCVQFSSAEGSFKKEKPVLAEKCLTMQIDKSVETNVNNLLGLLGDCKNIKVVLSILPKIDYDLQNLFLCSICNDTKLPAIFRSNDNYHCSSCKQTDSFLVRNMEYLYKKLLKPCKNNSAGCTYLNINKKLVNRHILRECKWQEICFYGCKLSFNELQNHFVTSHLNTSIYYKWLKIDSLHYGYRKTDDTIIFCKLLMKKTLFEVYIYTDLPAEDIHLYKCIIEISKVGKVTLNCALTAEHDWEIRQILENNPYIDKDNEFQINDIIITKSQ